MTTQTAPITNPLIHVASRCYRKAGELAAQAARTVDVGSRNELLAEAQRHLDSARYARELMG